MRWRLYYADGSTYEGETSEEAFAVPAVGVLVLKQQNDDPENWRGYSLRTGMSFLTWENIMRSDGTVLDECRWGVKNDLFGLMDYYTNQTGPQKVLIGREVHDQTYIDIARKAKTDGCLCVTPCNHRI